MKIELELPDWVDERTLRIFAGIESVATKDIGGTWQVKESRCNLCGTCCGDCKELIYSEGDKGYMCNSGWDRPFGCCVGDGVGNGKCNITWIDTSKK